MAEHEEIINSIIPQKLRDIEERENVKIIHCVESGSRAWGFASPDSDYDVRFIYVRQKEFYLRLNEERDVIEWQLDDTLDINGWDVQKLLRLLHNSNPTVFEWNNSPIVYKTTPQWNRISAVINNYFHQKSGLYHYLSMAKRNYREFLQKDIVSLKKYFYVLRPILACRWILEKQCPPPMLFSELAAACLEPSVAPEVNKLLSLKVSMSELGEGERIDCLNQYIGRSIEEIDEALAGYKRDEHYSWDELNSIFAELL